jgi:hypothetical protein
VANRYHGLDRINIPMVDLTTTQVETFLGKLEYIEPLLKALGVIGAGDETDNV